MFELLQSLVFRLQSRTEYGVHSPFVYALLTESIYKPPSVKASGPHELVRRVASHCGLERIGIHPDIHWKDCSWPVLEPGAGEAWDLVVLDSPQRALSSIGGYEKNCVIYVDRPYLDRARRDAHLNVLRDPGFHVALDFFRGAFLFPRPQQGREIFRIRLK